FVTPVVLEFLARHPEVTVRTLFVDRIVDLVEEGLDVAVRIAILPDSSLTAVRVGTVRRVLCASAGYLGRHGRPKRPGDLARHETISFTNGTHEPEWSFLVNGKRESVAPKARLVVNSADVAIA